ncbi:MAG: SAM-dependent DNA methyltransferase [Spirochaetes bacterium]|nr:MAG: SAM-dependent DNA methyltransferase [Spirochaetota bacterium]
MLQNNPGIKSLIDKLWDRFWSGGIANPLTAIEQITYLLFMKRIDDLDLKRTRDAEFTGEPHTSLYKGTFTLPGTKEKIRKETLRWSHFKRMQAEEMLLHVQTRVFPFLKQMNGAASSFTHHMQNAYFVVPKPSLLVEAIGIIEDIFIEIDKDSRVGGQTFQDIQGDVYEMLLGEIASAGKNGQFRTPRHIIKLICELVAPQLGQKVADPACGTGGFLLGAYQYMVTQLDKNRKKLSADEDGFVRSSVSGLLTEKVKTILGDCIFGFDFDTTMVRLGLMNLMMHGIDDPRVDYRDTLSKSFNEENRYEIIMANPPFTGNIDKGDIYEGLKLPTTKTELLFTERIFTMLKVGGTAGIIVPQGVLFGSGKAFVLARTKLVEEAELKAVITMPSGVFKPYAGVSTAILIFTRGGRTEHTWFYEMEGDGYSLDDKRTKLEGKSDLHDIVTKYKARDPKKDTDRKGKGFFVPKKEIADNGYDLSLNRYKEEVYDEVEYEKPAVILEKLEKIEQEIMKGLDELKGTIDER